MFYMFNVVVIVISLLGNVLVAAEKDILGSKPFDYPVDTTRLTLKERMKLKKAQENPNTKLKGRRLDSAISSIDNSSASENKNKKHNFFINNNTSVGVNNALDVEVAAVNKRVKFLQQVQNYITLGYSYAVTDKFKIGTEIEYGLYGMGNKQNKEGIIFENNYNYGVYLSSYYTIYSSGRWHLSISPRVGVKNVSNTIGYKSTREIATTDALPLSMQARIDSSSGYTKGYYLGKDLEEACILDKINTSNDAKDSFFIYTGILNSDNLPILNLTILGGVEYIGGFKPGGVSSLVCTGYWFKKADYSEHVLNEKVDFIDTIVAYGLNLSASYYYTKGLYANFIVAYNGTLPGKSVNQGLGTAKQYQALKTKYRINNKGGATVDDTIPLNVKYKTNLKATYNLSIGFGITKEL